MNLRDKLRGQAQEPVEATIPEAPASASPFDDEAPAPAAASGKGGKAKGKLGGTPLLPKLDVNRRFLMLAGVVAGLTAVMAVVYLNKAGSGLEAAGEKIKVVVAKTDIAAGDELTPDVLTTMEVPAAYLIDEHFYEAPGDLENRIATAPMLKDEIIYDVRTSEPNPKYGIAYLLKAGERAKSISVDSASGLAGLIKPGNEVDLVATIPDPEDNSRRISTPVLQKAKVIAVGDQLLGAPPSDEEAANGGISSSGTITLAVQAKKIPLITLLEDLGNLKAVLRATSDNTVVQNPYSDAQVMALVSGRIPPKEAPAPKPVYVPTPRVIHEVVHEDPPPQPVVHRDPPPAPKPRPVSKPKPASKPKPPAPAHHDVEVIHFGN